MYLILVRGNLQIMQCIADFAVEGDFEWVPTAWIKELLAKRRQEVSFKDLMP